MYGFVLESSDWALSEVAIWRGALREDEMSAVSKHLMEMLTVGSSALYSQTLNVSCDNIDGANNNIAPYVSNLGCRYRSSQTRSTCDASMYGASRVCLCAAPCLEDYYGSGS